MKEKYDVKLEGKEWKDCLKQAFNKKKKDIKMDGFRKGQVPYDVYVKKTLIEKMIDHMAKETADDKDNTSKKQK